MPLRRNAANETAISYKMYSVFREMWGVYVSELLKYNECPTTGRCSLLDGRLGAGVVSKGLLHCTCMIGPHRWIVEEDRAFQADSKVKMGRERALLMCTTKSGQAGGGNELRLWQSNIV